MWRVKVAVMIVTVLCSAVALKSQNVSSILEFIGTDDAEEINPYDVERLEELLERPLKLNYVSESKLEESGLLSRYQIASLSDYRSRHGDVLSFSELSLVDGFSKDFVSRLAPFISLESTRLPGRTASSSVHNDIALRASFKSPFSYSYGLKYKISSEKRLSGGLAVSRASSALTAAPDAYSAYVALNFIRRPGKIIVGGFNARFGQGLALWNGMSFSGLTSASSFMKRPSFISPSSSFTGNNAHNGIAADIGFGRFRIASFVSLSKQDGSFSVLPALNVSWLMKRGQVSLIHYADFMINGHSAIIPDMKTSADVAFCIEGMDIFAESSYDWVSSSLASLVGICSPIGEYTRIAGMLRYYQASYSASRSAAARSTTKCSNEYAASLAVDYDRISRICVKASSDFAYFPIPKSSDAKLKSIQIKAQVAVDWKVSESFCTSFRISERIRTWGDMSRTDIRGDFSYISEHFVANLRANALFCKKMGLLSYLEGGYRADKLSAYLRSGVFFIDNWEDRIYVYERDAPGSFNVPALYGRGVWAAVTLNWKFAPWGRAYLRAAGTFYPFMQVKKPGRAELKLQFVFNI